MQLLISSKPDTYLHTNGYTPFLAADVTHTELAYIASGQDVIECHVMDVSKHVFIGYGLEYLRIMYNGEFPMNKNTHYDLSWYQTDIS